MKELKIGNRILQYETVANPTGWDGSTVTKFYEGTETFTERKYLIFGPKVIKTRPKFLFQIWADTQNDRLTKEWWAFEIRKELSLLNRRAELNKDELI